MAYKFKSFCGLFDAKFILIEEKYKYNSTHSWVGGG